MALVPPVLHSVYGKKLGITHRGEITGDVGFNEGNQALTSASTATQITAYGVTTIQVTTLSTPTFILAPPVPGVSKTIAFLGTSTGVKTISLSTALGGNFQSTAGSSFITSVFNSPYQHLNLKGLSTAIWQVLTNTSSAAMTT